MRIIVEWRRGKRSTVMWAGNDHGSFELMAFLFNLVESMQTIEHAIKDRQGLNVFKLYLENNWKLRAPGEFFYALLNKPTPYKLLRLNQ